MGGCRWLKVERQSWEGTNLLIVNQMWEAGRCVCVSSVSEERDLVSWGGGRKAGKEYWRGREGEKERRALQCCQKAEIVHPLLKKMAKQCSPGSKEAQSFQRLHFLTKEKKITVHKTQRDSEIRKCQVAALNPFFF